MRLHQRTYLALGLSVATVAVLAVFPTIEAEAAMRGGGFSGGRMNFGASRPMMMRSMAKPRITTATSKMVTGKYAGSKIKYGSKITGSKAAAVINPPKDGGRKPPKTPPTTGGDKPPKGPVVGENPPTRWPVGRYPRPWIGPAVIGTGVLVGPALAAPIGVPPPQPPPGGGPAGPQITLGPVGGINIPPITETRFVPNEVVLEFAGSFSPQAMDEMARRHRLARLELISLQSTGTTYFRARIVDGRPVRAVLAALRVETQLRAGQPNYIYAASQTAGEQPATFTPPAATTPTATPVAAAAGALPALGGDPAQYALTKLRLQEAHSLTKGSNILVAVIDSGVDAGHPELRGVIASTFDALGKAEKPHLHGTAIAGTIAARSRLMGVAPAARILAIRAFGATGNSAEATTFAIIKGIEHAMTQNARVINMSFNGPADPGMGRQLATARGRGIVLVAAAGNLGASSPPQYPAADPNVIAVSATDAEDNLFKASNRGLHIAVAAPGVDILVPAPQANYQVTSGTSFAAAHVSGVIALILERKPSLDPDSVKKILVSTARDLGPVGPDEQFGAGLADAYQALLALEPRIVAGPDVPAAQPPGIAAPPAGPPPVTAQ